MSLYYSDDLVTVLDANPIESFDSLVQAFTQFNGLRRELKPANAVGSSPSLGHRWQSVNMRHRPRRSLRCTQLKQDLSLSTLNGQVGQEAHKRVCRPTVGRLPVEQRTPLCNGWALHHERATEPLAQQRRDLRSHLLEANALLVSGRPRILRHPDCVCGSLDSYRSVRVHRACQISI